jgi:hypothetical protein
LLSGQFREPRRQGPHEGVRAAAGRERQNDTYGFCGIGLGVGANACKTAMSAAAAQLVCFMGIRCICVKFKGNTEFERRCRRYATLLKTRTAHSPEPRRITMFEQDVRRARPPHTIEL